MQTESKRIEVQFPAVPAANALFRTSAGIPIVSGVLVANTTSGRSTRIASLAERNANTAKARSRRAYDCLFEYATRITRS